MMQQDRTLHDDSICSTLAEKVYHLNVELRSQMQTILEEEISGGSSNAFNQCFKRAFPELPRERAEWLRESITAFFYEHRLSLLNTLRESR